METGILSFGGSWTEEKLEIIRKYLHAYTTALKKQGFELIYIDAFAGTGYCGKQSSSPSGRQLDIFPDLADEDAQAYITGSARIALETTPAFQKYVYIDLDPDNCAKLHDLKNEFPSKASAIEIVNADANDYIRQLVQTTDWRGTRAVLFLDPFGMEVRWETVSWVAKSRAIDMWYLFPVSAVMRMLTRTGEMPSGWAERLNALLGSTDWAQRFYETSTDAHLFGNTKRTVKTATWSTIEAYILEHLRTEFPGVAAEPRYLRNPRTNTTLFLFCFAAANPGKAAELAVKMAQQIMDGMDK